MFFNFGTFLCIILCVYKCLFCFFIDKNSFLNFILVDAISHKSYHPKNLGFHPFCFISPSLRSSLEPGGGFQGYRVYGKQDNDSSNKKIPFPLDDDAPLRDVPVPPWAIEFVGPKRQEEPYVPRHYSQKEIESGIEAYNVEARQKSETKLIKETPCVKLKSYGFKFKQIQPIRHHNGRAFTFFYVHSLHTDVVPVFLNSLRRVAKRHLGAGRITALRIPGMVNEFYSVVGLREDFFELSRNLRRVVFRNVPETATFQNPIIATLRVKGPIIAVAGHLKVKGRLSDLMSGRKPDSEKEEPKDSDSTVEPNLNDLSDMNEVVINRPYSDKIEIVNKNHYLCSVSNGSYLTMDVKIEHISNYVIPEHGPESLNRDITEDGFIHFSSSCNPVEIFGFSGERRGIDEKSTSEIVTLELHTDGATTPRLALLKSATYLINWFDRTLYALRSRLSRDYFSMKLENVTNTSPMMLNHEMNRNLPWNPYLLPDDRVSNRLKWFFRKDVLRQYPIDPESRLAKEEQLKDWQRILEDQIVYEQRISPVLSDDEADPEDDLYTKRLREQRKRDDNPPNWMFRDPIGPGNISQQSVLGMDNDPPPVPTESPFN